MEFLQGRCKINGKITRPPRCYEISYADEYTVNMFMDGRSALFRRNKKFNFLAQCELFGMKRLNVGMPSGFN